LRRFIASPDYGERVRPRQVVRVSTGFKLTRLKVALTKLNLDKDIIMTKNDILRRIRYTFDFDDSKMIAIFGLAGHQVTREQISDWLKKDDDPACQEFSDTQLAIFLNGLINDKRGKKEGPQPEPEKHLTNNMIFMKLKIALNLKAEDVLEIMDLASFPMSKPELSAFFRRPGHKHYRDCKNQILRNFLKGVQYKYRPNL
jgi:uncharacterized protein YehS (DUF1456 family)